ncbi:hypothetical protein O9992_29810 [Vibrio lentus]|nr:hypothetical protein [Vibrio lentus]
MIYVFLLGPRLSFQVPVPFESAVAWDQPDGNPSNRLATGDNMDEGTLYVARFNEDNSGTWLP